METRACQNCKKDFTIEPDDFSFYEKIQVPAPTFCPICRMQRRMMFRNERKLYKNKCSLTGQNLVTIFGPDSGVKVLHRDVWWGDTWDQYESAMEYDPTRSFFEQFQELQRKTYWPNLITGGNLVNSEYVNHVSDAKNCYLIFNADYCDTVLYASIGTNSCDSMDMIMFNKTELCYELVDGNGTKVCFSENCDECLNVYFSKDCIGCTDCFGCVNLRKQKYCMWNEQLTKEEYERRFTEYRLDLYSVVAELRDKAQDFWLQFPKKYYHGRQNVDSTGDYIFYSKNAKNCFYTVFPEDCKFCSFITSAKCTNSYDISEWGQNLNFSYECVTAGENSDSVKFSFAAWAGAQNVEYCMMTPGSRNCFGCCNVKKAEYCILNKQYTKEEYLKLRQQIIDDMKSQPYVDAKGRTFSYGEFFPYELSMFDYNESWAQDFVPLDKVDALSDGFRWREDQDSTHVITRESIDLPDSINDIDDGILDEVLGCKDCGKGYRIVTTELLLLRRLGLPLPRSCFACRHARRMTRVNMPMLYGRYCMLCNSPVQTSYAPDRPEIIYCESCYQKEVI